MLIPGVDHAPSHPTMAPDTNIAIETWESGSKLKDTEALHEWCACAQAHAPAHEGTPMLSTDSKAAKAARLRAAAELALRAAEEAEAEASEEQMHVGVQEQSSVLGKRKERV